TAAEGPIESVPAPPRADDSASLDPLLGRPGAAPDPECRGSRRLDRQRTRTEARLGPCRGRMASKQMVEPLTGDSDCARGQPERHGAATRQVHGPPLDARRARCDSLQNSQPLEALPRARGEEPAADLRTGQTVLF